VSCGKKEQALRGKSFKNSAVVVNYTRHKKAFKKNIHATKPKKRDPKLHRQVVFAHPLNAVFAAETVMLVLSMSMVTPL